MITENDCIENMLAAPINKYIWGGIYEYGVVWLDIGNPHFYVREPRVSKIVDNERLIKRAANRLVRPVGEFMFSLDNVDWLIKSRSGSAKESDCKETIDNIIEDLDSRTKCNRVH